jgi:5-bromo-4-chloroindolyl phosphate hydrolysis protein
MRRPVLPGLLAGLLGGGVCLVLLLLFNVPLFWSLLAGAAGTGAGFLIFGTGSRRRGEIVLPESGADRQLAEEAVREGRGRVEELRRTIGRIPDKPVRARAEAIAEVADRILEDIRKDPKDVRPARQFFSYYLDATVRVLGKYVELRAHGEPSEAVRLSLRRVEDNLELIRSAFQKQLGRLLEDDVLDLDTEIALLEKTIRLEGLGEDSREG